MGKEWGLDHGRVLVSDAESNFFHLLSPNLLCYLTLHKIV